MNTQFTSEDKEKLQWLSDKAKKDLSMNHPREKDMLFRVTWNISIFLSRGFYSESEKGLVNAYLNFK